MKVKVMLLGVMIFTFLLLPAKVLGAGSIDLSTNKITLKKGETTTFTITANNAAGKVILSSSDSSVATIEVQSKTDIDTDSDIFLDNSSKTIKVTALEEGTCDILVELDDVTTYDAEALTDSKKIEVEVGNATSDESATSSESGSTPESNYNNTNTNQVEKTTVKASNNISNPKTVDVNVFAVIALLITMCILGFVGYKKVKKTK